MEEGHAIELGARRYGAGDVTKDCRVREDEPQGRPILEDDEFEDVADGDEHGKWLMCVVINNEVMRQ